METSELSVRFTGSGIPLAEQVELRLRTSVPDRRRPEAGSPNGRHSILLLIHGYNVSLEKARQAYDSFMEALDRLAPNGFSLPVYQFMWPGDDPNTLQSALSYFRKIDVATDSGILLASFLRNLHGPDGGPIDVHVVAHSLGNRVLLQMLDRIASSPNVVVRSAVLMAAAVPVELVTYNQQFFAACLVPRQSLVLHSVLDLVLAGPFRVGETLHGDTCMPSAVGWLGEPVANWTHHKSYNGFSHGDYWVRPGPPRQVLDLLGVATPHETPNATIPSRSTPKWRWRRTDWMNEP
jgi:hypothetical protein